VAARRAHRVRPNLRQLRLSDHSRSNPTGGSATGTIDTLIIDGLTACDAHFDDFNRVAPFNEFGDGTWGTSNSGYTWGNFDAPLVTIENGWGVLSNGVAGDPSEGTGIAGSGVDGVPFLEPTQGMIGGLGDPAGPRTHWTMTTRFMVDVVPPIDDAADEIVFYGWGGTNYPQMTVDVSIEPGTGGIYVNGTSSVYAEFIDWEANVPYLLKWEMDLNTHITRAKVWREADSEPDWLASSDTLQDPGFPGHGSGESWNSWTVAFFTNRPPDTKTVRFDWIDLAARPRVARSGSSGDTQVSDGSSTYNLTMAYQPQTTEVYVNGLLQIPDVDYTESSPSQGTITWINVPSSSDRVLVFYIAVTATGGSGGGGKISV
jgi:hypothetical protein